jgi:hypothetical protein
MVHGLRRALPEFPLPTLGIGSWRVPVLAGAYLRLWPSFISRFAAREHLRRRRPLVVNVHPWEVDPDQPTIGGAAGARGRITLGSTGPSPCCAPSSRERGSATSPPGSASSGSSMAASRRRGRRPRESRRPDPGRGGRDRDPLRRPSCSRSAPPAIPRSSPPAPWPRSACSSSGGRARRRRSWEGRIDLVRALPRLRGHRVAPLAPPLAHDRPRPASQSDRPLALLHPGPVALRRCGGRPARARADL